MDTIETSNQLTISLSKLEIELIVEALEEHMLSRLLNFRQLQDKSREDVEAFAEAAEQLMQIRLRLLQIQKI